MSATVVVQTVHDDVLPWLSLCCRTIYMIDFQNQLHMQETCIFAALKCMRIAEASHVHFLSIVSILL